MQPVTVEVQLDAADDDGIAQNQQPGAAGDLTLNGALVSGGVATLTDAGAARQVLLTSAGDESGKTFTIYGTNATGNPISEEVTGPNTTATTVQHFRTVTRVAVSAATGGNVKVGTNGVGSSRPIGLNVWGDAPTSLQVDVSGTVNFTVQQTLDDIDAVGAVNVNWVDHPDSALASATSTAQGNYAYLPLWVRLKINSGTGTAALTVLQPE